jgi:hypothetical protein
MQTITVGGGSVELRGTILAPLTWYNEFHDDGLFKALARVEQSPANMLDVLKVAWVMAHDAQVAAGGEAHGFDAWATAAVGEADFSAIREAVMAESSATWFRRAVEQIGAAEPAGGAEAAS